MQSIAFQYFDGIRETSYEAEKAVTSIVFQHLRASLRTKLAAMAAYPHYIIRLHTTHISEVACKLTSLCSEWYVCDPQCDGCTHWAIAVNINVN